VRIPLPKLMRHWRECEFERHLQPRGARFGLRLWAFCARRPRLYRWLANRAARILRLLGGRTGRIRRLPLAKGWSAWRDMPVPEGQTFQQQWAQRTGRSL
jgi:L-lactate dehydrogenase complex protein LldF